MKQEKVFIPERYLARLELLDEVPKHGRGIKVLACELRKEIKSGRIHPNVITNRDVVYIIEETGIQNA